MCSLIEGLKYFKRWKTLFATRKNSETLRKKQNWSVRDETKWTHTLEWNARVVRIGKEHWIKRTIPGEEKNEEPLKTNQLTVPGLKLSSRWNEHRRATRGMCSAQRLSMEGTADSSQTHPTPVELPIKNYWDLWELFKLLEAQIVK